MNHEDKSVTTSDLFEIHRNILKELPRHPWKGNSDSS